MSVSRFYELLREPARPKRRVAGYVVAVVGPIALAFVLVPFRDSLRSSTVGFAFVVIVVIAASLGRVGPGIVASIEGFLIFNFFFLPPFGTFVIERPEDVTALFVFLGLSILISILFARAAERADAAEAREAELRTLQELSRDLVVQGPGEETYRALLEHLVGEFGFDAGSLFVQEQGEGLVESMAVGAEAGMITPTWDPSSSGRAPERLPLSVGRRNLGLIVLVGERPPLDAPESRVIRAVCDQLALVLERDRLLRTATEAEIFRQTDQIRRSMLAAVSHDLRSPLAAIKASVTDLLDPEVERPPGEQLEVLRTIDTETDRLDMLVANLLDMSRIEAGVLQAKPESVDLAEVVTKEVDGAAVRWPGIHVDVAIDERHASASADPVFLDRVLSNLLDNAARASIEAGRMEVEVRVGGRGSDGATVVRVVDHGHGVDPVAREQLFYPFYRLEGRTSKLGPGLGLAISKGFVDLMGGELWIEDTSGGGATFAFSLPGAGS
ncbi:MAG TPA: ATP-binding protein [Actinomycetota bacterium]|nr:ATP-binding protein [Actinomycetota bacterium]